MSRIAPPNDVASSPMSQRTELSVPTPPWVSVALTVVDASALRTASPLAFPSDSDGMTTVGSTPAMPNAPLPPRVWLAMMTPTAPFSCAFLDLTTKPQVPRYNSAILPLTAAALANGVSHPSMTDRSPAAPDGGLALPVPSLTRTTSFVTLKVCGPYAEPPDGFWPAMDAGELMVTDGGS